MAELIRRVTASEAEEGLETFRSARRDSEIARTTQLLCMAVFMAGNVDQIELIIDHASKLGVPRPRPVTATAASRTLGWLQKAASGEYRRADVGESRDTVQIAHRIVEIEDRDVSLGVSAESDAITRYWRNIQSFQSSQASLALMYSSLSDDSESVRVAAASALALLHPLPNERVREVLLAALESKSALVSEMAVAALSAPESDGPSEPHNEQSSDVSFDEPVTPGSLLEENGERVSDGPKSMSMVVHGTFARLTSAKGRWYEPMAPLPQRLVAEANADLYGGVDYFRWSAGYSDASRAAGAKKLIDWCAAHGTKHLGTVYAHSHGGNVVLDAMEQGLKVGLLVLLHVPIFPRDLKRWAIIDSNVQRVFDLRTPLDWVVLIDGLKTGSRNGFRGELSTVERPTPPVTQSTQVSHTRYTKDTVWEALGLTSDIREQLSLL